MTTKPPWRHEGWTWSRRWRLPGDSIVGLYLRFLAANVIGLPTLKSLVAAANRVSAAGGTFLTPRGDSTEWGSVAQLLQIDDSDLRQARLLDVNDALAWTPVVSPRFRYCAKCLAIGYHGRFFQLAALDECPIHREPLLDHCAHCNEATPPFGFCKQLLQSPYICSSCSGAFAGTVPRVPDYFAAERVREALTRVWAPMEKWVVDAAKLNVIFGALREWASSPTGGMEPNRALDALHIVGTVLPLPGAPYVWKAPTVPRKALRLVGDVNHRGRVHVDEGAIVARYCRAIQTVQRNFLTQPTDEVDRLCRQYGWGVFDARNAPQLGHAAHAYVLWRMYFENFDDPALLDGGEPARGVSISDETMPCSWLNPMPAQWTIIFLAVYRSLLYDVNEAAAVERPVADVRRFPAGRQCCFLPTARSGGRGGGIFVYPVPRL